MSYDFYGVDTGDSERYLEPAFSDTHPAFDGDGMAGNVMLTARGYTRCGNYTSNVSGMWRKCLTAALDTEPSGRRWVDPDGDLRLGGLDGARCGDIAPVLRAAVAWGVEHIGELREGNPENGWGNAEGAVTYLWDIQRFCEANPKCDLHISR